MLSSLGYVPWGLIGHVPRVPGVGPPGPGVCSSQNPTSEIPKGLDGLWLESTEEENAASKLEQGQGSQSKAGREKVMKGP